MTNNISCGERDKILDGIVDSFYIRACICKFFNTLNLDDYVDRYILFEVMQRYRNNREVEKYIDSYINIINDVTKLEDTSVANDVSKRLMEIDKIIKKEKEIDMGC